MKEGDAGDAPRALLLTAGLGTRLRPLTYLRAKAAVPVNGEPLARRIIRWLAAQGVDDLVLNLHHEPASVTAVVGDGSDLGVRVRYTWEQPVLGSAGGPRRALPLLTEADRDQILLVNGDTLTDVDVHALLARHHASGAAVTLAVIPNPSPHQYGGVRISDDERVTAFTRRGTPGVSYHFIGVQAASARTFAALEDGVAVESVGDLYRRMIAADAKSVAAFVCAASFHDIGTPADYLETSLRLAGAEGDRLISDSARVHPSARVVRTALWDHVTVGASVRLTDCTVSDGAHIPDGASYRRCAIAPADGRPPAGDERVENGLLVREF